MRVTSRIRRYSTLREVLTSRMFRICINMVCFAVTIAGLFATFFWLAAPVILVGFPVAIFAKSRQAKEIAVSCLLALTALIVVFNVKAIIEGNGPFGP